MWYYQYNGKMLNYLDNICDEHKMTPIVKLTPRLLFQLLGTECGREIIHPNIWCNTTFNSFNVTQKWIITDTRFENEVKKIKDNGGIIIKIERLNDNNNFHQSEMCVDYLKYDYVIKNNGTINDLIEQIKEILNIL